MDGEASNKIATIKTLFETMEYGEILEKTTNLTWLKDNNLHAHANTNETPTGDSLQLHNVNNDEILCNIYIPTRSTIEEVLSKPGSEWIKLQPLHRAGLICKLASELRKNQASICEAEVAARGIHSRETKRHLELLTDYLEYYAGFSLKCKDAEQQPEGLSIGIISDQTALFLLGSNLGPALAAGYNVVMLTEPKISYVTSLLVELARKVGIPQSTIRLIPSLQDDVDVFFAHSKVEIVSIYGHNKSQQFNQINWSNKKVLNYSMTASRIPMIVFDSADLDSACQSVLKAVWGYQGMLPWNVRNVLVQENILDSFYAKLKQALTLAKIGNGNVQNVDVTYPIKNKALEKLLQIVEASRKQGIEVFQTEGEKFPLTILSGHPFTNNVIEKDPIDVPLAILTAFRTIDEAVNLANNSKQGLAASVWTDSLSLANEVVKKLQVTTVWINSHGIFSAEVPVTPFKNSGKGSFGGISGFYEFSNSPKKSELIPKQNEHYINDKNEIVNMENAIADLKKTRSSWAKASRLERFRKLEAVITKASKKEHGNFWLEALFQYESKQIDSTLNSPTFSVTLTKEPRGLIAVEVEDTEIKSANLVITALMEGNVVIVMASTKQYVEFFSVLVPSGVLKVLPESLQARKVAALHKGVDVYFGTGPNEAFKTPESASKFQIVPFDPDEAIRNTTLVKSVWSNIGQSFM